MRTRRAVEVLFLAIVVVLAAGCRIEGKRQGHAAIGAGGAALRAAFNDEAGKVRVVVLVAPT